MENKIKQSTQKTIIFQTGIINLCINEETKSLEERIKTLENKIQNGIGNNTTTIPIKTDLTTDVNTTKKDTQSKTDIEIEKSHNIEDISNRPLTIKEETQKKETELKIETSNLKSQEFWPNILQQLKSNGKLMIYANLLNSRAVELNDMTIGIEFQGKLNDFSRKLLEQNENKKEVEKLVSIACGKEMQIKYIDKPVGAHCNVPAPQATAQKLKEDKKTENNISSLDDLASLGIDINYIDE